MERPGESRGVRTAGRADRFVAEDVRVPDALPDGRCPARKEEDGMKNKKIKMEHYGVGFADGF
ncbi:MAG: hypothetical protein IKH34_09440 [Oscillospiraceae bacterium]|nr:hypothetical protein [Oscillospiraceae bacterium]